MAPSLAKMMFEILRCNCHQRWNAGKIPIRVCDLTVAKVNGKVHNLSVYIDPLFIPRQQSAAGESMAQVVESRWANSFFFPAETSTDGLKGVKGLPILERGSLVV